MEAVLTNGVDNIYSFNRRYIMKDMSFTCVTLIILCYIIFPNQDVSCGTPSFFRKK